MSCSIRTSWEHAGGKVPEHWSFTTIEKLLETPKSVSVGVMYPGKDTLGGVPLIKVSDVKSGELLGKPDFCISPEVDEEYKRTRLNGTELLITLVGNPGDCVLVTDDMKGWNAARALAVVRLREPELCEWLRYVLLSKPAKHLIDARLNTTVQKTLNLKDVKELPIPIPPLVEREQITKTIRDIEKRVNLNTQTNQTLEEMAQAIFKSWFVDFDPVKEKMRGEHPEGMDVATASLFPEKLVESELGLIPEGWEVSTLSSLIKLTGGGTPKRSEDTYWNGDIPWFSVKDVPSGSDVFVVDTDEKITEIGLNKSSTKLLPKGTTIITARGTVGKLALVGTDMCMNQSCYGIRGNAVGDFYNYFNLKQAVSTLQQNTHGAVFDTITTKTFDTYSMAFSGAELANKFDTLVAPLLQKIEANVRQNIELATLRDTLLPKLLSGEIELGCSEALEVEE
ncbi:restriction endonuclease subunit S [Photobacterium sagamiensis]|uniref:restriction endonuclease subunit S n=1 Tax=Photobacterium sagamiensis TaxID=2910241 RepID=UPI003D0ACE17